MEKVRIKFINCYGIPKLETGFIVGNSANAEQLMSLRRNGIAAHLS